MAGRETGAEWVAACMLCWPRLLKFSVSRELCMPMNAPFDSGRLMGSER
jgi:hypothetical protein